MQKVKYSYEDFTKLPLEERKKLYLEQKARRPNSIPTILQKFGKSLLPELPECRYFQFYVESFFLRIILPLSSKLI